MIAYFTLFLGEYCSHMMLNRTLKHKHHKILMNSPLFIVNALYPNVTLGFPHLKQNSRLFPVFFLGFPTDILDTFKGSPITKALTCMKIYMYKQKGQFCQGD